MRPEHYLEAIYVLSRSGKVALSALAGALGVKPSSVLRRLEAQGCVAYRGRGGVEMTEHDLALASPLNRAHGVLAEFFKLMGVEEEVAKSEAEKPKHIVDFKVVERIAEVFEVLKKLRGPSCRV